MSDDSPRIFVAYTGGTIGMRRTEDGGYAPASGYLQARMRDIPAFQEEAVPAYDVYEFDPLLDSSNMTPAHWLQIAEVIQTKWDAYDGFLVVHGTDTMAFTASALSFMLDPLDKPVVLTGSQIPLAETRNDAQGNLLTSLLLLGAYSDRLPGVYLFFDDHLYRGNRTTKVNADAFAAFASPNFSPVGRVGINVEIDWSLVPDAGGPAPTPSVVELGTASVSAFRIFPGLDPDSLRNLLSPPVQGVVLECFGSGNAPDQNDAFLAALREATDRGVVIVAVTQPLRGTADLNLYATGHALQKAGVVSGFDITTEAALAKLYYLFEQGLPPAKVRDLMQENLRGELTPPEETPAELGKTRRRLAGYR